MTPEEQEARNRQLAEARRVRSDNAAERREAKEAENPKKGAKSWKPAKRLEMVDKVPGYRYRWVDHTDSQNLARKEAEGWVRANELTGLAATHQRPAEVADGKPLDGTTTYRELTLYALPEEQAKLRDEYIEAETKKQTVGRARRLQSEVREAARESGAIAADVHQRIIIE